MQTQFHIVVAPSLTHHSFFYTAALMTWKGYSYPQGFEGQTDLIQITPIHFFCNYINATEMTIQAVYSNVKQTSEIYDLEIT